MALHLTMLLAHGLSRVLAFAPVMGAPLLRAARRGAFAPVSDQPPHAGTRLDAVTRALSPRIALAFGVPFAALPTAPAVFAIGTPEVPARRPNTQHISDAALFFARPPFKRSRIPRAERLPAYFDLAVIGAAYDDAAAAEIMKNLRPLAHQKSTIILLRGGGRGPGNRARRILQDALKPKFMARIDTAVAIAGGLPRTRHEAPTRFASELPIKAFVDRFSIPEPQTISALGTLVQDGPGVPGRAILPIYRDISASERVSRRKVKGYAVDRWWQKPLALLTTGITMYEDVGIVPCEGSNQMWLIDAAGAPLPAAFVERDGFGPKADGFARYSQPSFVFDSQGTKRPTSEAGTLLDGPVRPGDHLLIGRADSRFGHMLLESLSRAWAIDWALERGMRFLAWDRPDRFHEWFGAALGIPADAIVTAEPGARYDRIFIPCRGFRLCGSVSPVMAAVWDRIADHALATGEAPALDAPFVYLSRRANPRRRLLNEDALEQALVARGGLVIAPETLPFHDQVRLAAVAPALVGCAGSQLHLSIFAKPGARKLVIGNENHLGPDELLIGIAKGLEVTHYIERAAERGHDPMRAAWHLDLNRFLPAFDTWMAEKSATPPAPPAEPLVLT